MSTRISPTRFNDLRHDADGADKRAARSRQPLLEERTLGPQIYIYFALTTASGLRL